MFQEVYVGIHLLILTISNSKTNESGGLGAFYSNLIQLTPNIIYYLRAYATTTAGIGYGDSKTFTTLQVAVPILTTTAITTITQTSAVSGENITDDKFEGVFYIILIPNRSL